MVDGNLSDAYSLRLERTLPTTPRVEELQLVIIIPIICNVKK
jgi:hypothetical protein